MSDPINLTNADFTFKDKNGNTGSNKGITNSDKTKLNNMVKLMNLILNTPNSTDYINTLRNGKLPTEIVISTTPLSDANLHLADGALLSGSGSYAKFVNEIIAKYTANPNASCWTTEANWQNLVATYGECGKYVIDTTNNTIRLPKLISFVQATSTASELGSLVEAGVPNITGDTGGVSYSNSAPVSGAFYRTQSTVIEANDGNNYPNTVYFDASRSNSIYGNSNTVQPQAVKYYFYIVVGTVSKLAIQVDIDQIATDLNGKADTDFSNVTAPTQAFKDMSIGWGMPDWDSKVQIAYALSSSYTVPEYGYIYIKNANDCNYFYSTINGLFFNVWLASTGMFPVRPNDIYMQDSKAGGGNPIIYFVPCKGV